MEPERVALFARQMRTLSECGVRYVSFTGGEPLMYPERVDTLSRAAVERGMSASVVTACHWASSPEAAGRMVDALPHIGTWHLSTDEFHTEFVPHQQAVWAALAASSAGARSSSAWRPTTRSATNTGLSTTKSGRGFPQVSDHGSGTGRERSARWLIAGDRSGSFCIPCGPLVRHDGTVAPCCSALANRRHRIRSETVEGYTATSPPPMPDGSPILYSN